MKKRIFLIVVLIILCFNKIIAQDCPTSITGSSSIFALQFNIGPVATTDPDDYPSTIDVLDSTGTVTITYTKGSPFENGIDNFVEYDSPSPEPWEGNEINIDNFTVDFGLGAGDCNYIGQVLPIDNYTANSNNINLFPNPIRKNQALNIYISNKETALVFIYDITGKMVINRNENSLKIDISNLNTGMYFVKIIGDTQVATRKLVVTD